MPSDHTLHPRGSKIALVGFVTAAILYLPLILMLPTDWSQGAFMFWLFGVSGCSVLAFFSVWHGRESWVAWTAAGLGLIEVVVLAGVIVAVLNTQW